MLNSIKLNITDRCLSQEELLGYVRRQIDAEEITRIEKHLLQCNLCFDAADGITELESKEDAAYHLNNLADDIKIKLNYGIHNRLRFYLSAAAMILIACTTVLLMLRKSDSVKLFEEYYKPYPNIIPMVRGTAADFDMKAAMVLYNSGNYQQAVTEFDKILSSDPENEAALFYKGISYLSLEKGDKAESDLEHALSLQNGKLKDQAEWYLALSYLLNDKVPEAENLLVKIVNEKNYYSPQAENLNGRLTGRNE